MDEFKTILFKGLQAKGLKDLNINVSEHQAQLMAMHAKELMTWNKKINLTAIKQSVQIVEKHFIDCLVAASFIKNRKSIIDMGSGGGFPGIILKIINPELEIVLMDSSRKKVNFLKHVIRLLDLKRVNAIHTRVQDLHENTLYENRFDAVISRAFTELSNFVDLASPFLNKNGAIYAMKGKLAKKEISPKLLERFKISTDHYVLPFERSDRYVIKLTKDF
ncbi:MAG: 16S rRNA (guanine(527)-N(7))-methyltransferase RsmG [Desulfobacula sp.]|nr:16S rRNA (guanine(527)-N(7))-methyltransferase RsmG [Desulfobacula sp.]